MFWNAVFDGLAVFLYWETYVAGTIYLLLSWVPMIAVGFVGMSMERKGVPGGAGIGCLGMLVQPFFQAIGVLVMIMTLSPIIFGISEDAAWAFPWYLLSVAPGAFAKVAGIVVVATILLAIVPVLGRVMTVQVLLSGAIALISVLGILDSLNPGTITKNVHMWPGFWFVVGIVVVSVVMVWVGMLAAAFMGVGLEHIGLEGWGQLLMIPVASIFGFLPVFIYGAWLGSQIRGVH